MSDLSTERLEDIVSHKHGASPLIVQELAREVLRLRCALAKYGAHYRWCKTVTALSWTCDCGFDKAREALKPSDEKPPEKKLA